jgi:hypothetical protein
MKKVFLVLAALCLLNAGCKKDVANVNLPAVTDPDKDPKLQQAHPIRKCVKRRKLGG